MSKKATQDEFIRRSIAKHGPDKFGYDKAVYVDAHSKVTIYCNTCNEYFDVKANSHMRGHGHSKCSMKRSGDLRRRGIDYFISKSVGMYGDVFDFSEFIYVTDRIKGTIKCKICGNTFERTLNTHTHPKKRGCPKCVKPNSLVETSRSTCSRRYVYIR